MSNDDFVIDDNGAWDNPSDALAWYRQRVKELEEALRDELGNELFEERYG